MHVSVLLQIHIASAKASIGMMRGASQQLFSFDACFVVLFDFGKFLTISLETKLVKLLFNI